ncbi:MAG: hypothetical protein ACT4PT_11540 [Methanobacteriota archaeon]
MRLRPLVNAIERFPDLDDRLERSLGILQRYRSELRHGRAPWHVVPEPRPFPRDVLPVIDDAIRSVARTHDAVVHWLTGEGDRSMP